VQESTGIRSRQRSVKARSHDGSPRYAAQPCAEPFNSIVGKPLGIVGRHVTELS
jgi:hypothetical protein